MAKYLVAALSAVLTIVTLVLMPAVVHAQDWTIGKLVGLSSGTCIRQGPGLSFPAHTQVPEDNWTVKIIDGPRVADGKIWWDTSRREAGDPSGGSGWVMQEQSDRSCFPVADHPLPDAQPPTAPPPTPQRLDYQGWLLSLQTWWFQQTAIVKLVLAAAIIVLTSSIWRWMGGIVFRLIAALISAVAIWLLLEFTRSVWEQTWQGIAQPVFGGDAPDLALLLAALPLVSWCISTLRRLVSGYL